MERWGLQGAGVDEEAPSVGDKGGRSVGGAPSVGDYGGVGLR